MFELMDTAVKKTFRRYGYDVFREGESGYRFFKENAKGSLTIRKITEEFGELSFTYRNALRSRKTERTEFIRSKGANVLSEICGSRFSLRYLEPGRFSVSANWPVSFRDEYAGEAGAIITRCLSVSESCYTVLNSDFYYRNDASRALLETDLKRKVGARAGPPGKEKP